MKVLMSIFSLYYKNLESETVHTSDFDIRVFQQYLEEYKKIYCHHPEKKSYKNNMQEYIAKVNSMPKQNYIKIGKYFLNHQYDLNRLKKFEEMCSDYYLLVPGYNSCFECELQLGLTGSIKQGEKPIDCLKREIEEEVGIVITNNISRRAKLRGVHFYDIELNKNYYIKENLEEKLVNRKDSKEKVSCLIYGKLGELKKALLRSKLKYHFIKSEGISHTLLVPIKLAIKILEIIMSNKCDRWKHGKGCRLYHY